MPGCRSRRAQSLSPARPRARARRALAPAPGAAGQPRPCRGCARRRRAGHAARRLAAPPVATWTRVRIVTQAPGVVLERRQGSLPTDPPPLLRGPYADAEPVWQPVCPAPCDTAVQLGGEYRIARRGRHHRRAPSPCTARPPSSASTPARTACAAPASTSRSSASSGPLAGGVFLAVEAVRPSADGLDTRRLRRHRRRSSAAARWAWSASA